jgi:WD40 repeat protein
MCVTPLRQHTSLQRLRSFPFLVTKCHIIPSSSYGSLFFPFFTRRHLHITTTEKILLAYSSSLSLCFTHHIMSHELTTKKPRHDDNVFTFDDLIIQSVCSFVPHRPTLNNVSLVSKHFKELIEKVQELQDKPWPIARNVRSGYSSHVLCVAFAPTGSTFATGGRDGSLRIWTAHSGKFTSLRMVLPITRPPVFLPFLLYLSRPMVSTWPAHLTMVAFVCG